MDEQRREFLVAYQSLLDMSEACVAASDKAAKAKSAAAYQRAADNCRSTAEHLDGSDPGLYPEPASSKINDAFATCISNQVILAGHLADVARTMTGKMGFQSLDDDAARYAREAPVENRRCSSELQAAAAMIGIDKLPNAPPSS